MRRATMIMAVIFTVFFGPAVFVGAVMFLVGISSARSPDKWIFITVGLLVAIGSIVMIGGAWYSVRSARRREEMEATHSPQQWLANAQWASRRIAPVAKTRFPSVLVLDTLPAPPGGTLRGHVEIDDDHRLRRAASIHVTFSRNISSV